MRISQFNAAEFVSLGNSVELGIDERHSRDVMLVQVIENKLEFVWRQGRHVLRLHERS